MRKVKYNDSFIYIDDAPLDENETGIFVNNDDLDKTKEIKTISKDELIDDTVVDLWGNSDE